MFKIQEYDFIKEITNNSDGFMPRMGIIFKNGYNLSIIQGEYSYGGNQGLYEIAIFNSKGEFNGNLFDESDQGDDVLGYLEKNRVVYYINKIGNL